MPRDCLGSAAGVQVVVEVEGLVDTGADVFIMRK